MASEAQIHADLESSVDTVPAKSLGRLLLVGTGILILVLSVARGVVFWANQAYLDSVSGSWTALAVDLAHGVFYRAVLGPDGYGGTRYFPFHFVLHAGLITAFGNPVRAGQVMAAVSVSLLVLGVHFTLRRIGASALLAGSCAALVLASQTVQEALLSIRGDALAAALTMWGVGLCIGSAVSAGAILVAAVLFAAAFATKVTAVSGFVAAFVYLAFTHQTRLARRLLMLTVSGMVIVLASTYYGSHGEAFAMIRSGVSTVRPADVLRAPLEFARLVRQVPETLVFVQLGLAAFLLLIVEGTWSLSVVFYASTLAMTVAIFAFEGTDTNHLIDLHAVSVLAAGAWIVSRGSSGVDFARAALAVAALMASLSLVSGLANRHSEQRHGTFDQALALVGRSSQPILAENPLVPIAAGQRPYLNDAFAFRLTRQTNPAIEARLWRDLADHRFVAVVLERDPHTDRGEDWYRSGFFGEGFIDQLERQYHEAGRVGERVVYRPNVVDPVLPAQPDSRQMPGQHQSVK